MIEKKLCTGCSSCFNACPIGAISMKEDKEGFLFPVIDEEKCTNCNLCKQKCPVLNEKKFNEAQDTVIAISANDEIRKESSSGGAFTLIANYILEKNGYVCGASFVDNFTKVQHILVDKKEDLKKLKTSKYIQSEIGGVFKEIKELLEKEKLVLFAGTPCQVDGLYHFLNKKYENLYTIDILCHGVPSPMIWKEHIKDKAFDLVDVNFRHKYKEWRASGLWMKKQYKNNDIEITSSKEEPFFVAFLKNVSLRNSCGSCEYARVPRVGDITLGDFWGINKYKRSLNDKKGLSLVIVNNKKAEDLINAIKENALVFSKVPMKAAIKGNPILKRPSLPNKLRDVFFKKIQKNIPVKKVLNDFLNDKFDGVIYNFWYSKNNYGAVLTAYAIQKYFEEKGYDYRLLDFKFSKNDKDKNPVFRKFTENYLRTTKEYKNLKELKTLNNEIDNFVVGSDQVFRDECINKMPFLNLLTFSDFNKRKVAFSASFGKDNFKNTKQANEIISRCLKRFDSVAVREKSALEICKNDLNIEAKHILDPVFLTSIEQFEKLIDKNNTNYDDKIVYYVLDKNEEINNQLKKLENVAKMEDLRSKNLSIQEFLTAIYKSKFFITDSFHGCCFALLFNIRFLCLKNINKGSARFDSLIETFDIADCFIDGAKDINIEKINSIKINWESIKNKINDEKTRADEWFKDVFENENKKTEAQIANEAEFNKNKDYSILKIEEKLPLKKRIFSVEQTGMRRTVRIFGLKIKFNK